MQYQKVPRIGDIIALMGTSLTGKIAVVAGATRGAGRGIAAALGEAGATVVCTGRSSTRSNATSDYDRPETIEETAAMVTDLGGRGIAIQVDHLERSQVHELADRIREEFGHIDILVNDIWGAELLKGPPAQWNTPIWDHDLEVGLRILALGLETHLITSHYLLPYVISEPGGLLIEVTDGNTAYNAAHYRISTFYDLVKCAVNRLAFTQGHELTPYQGTAVAVTPGWLRSEMMLENYDVHEENWRDALQVDRPDGAPTAPPGFSRSESPRYIGRGIAAMAADHDRGRWNQQSVTSADLAAAYRVCDVDGTRPDGWASE